MRQTDTCITCPANSTVVVQNGRVTGCACIPYHRNIKTGTTEAFPGAPCDIIYKVKAVIGYSDIAFTVQNPEHFNENPDTDAVKYVISAHRQGSATDVKAVHPADGSTITDTSNPTVVLKNLEPGYRYVVGYKAYNKDNQEVYTNVRKMEGVAVTHCGCSDADYARLTENVAVLETGNAESSATLTGTPRSFVVKQDEGYVTFDFVDDSRCEDAFAFSRDGGSFVPDYRYLAAEECSDKVISPGVAAADDLRKSKLTVFKQYMYCVRAVGQK